MRNKRSWGSSWEGLEGVLYLALYLGPYILVGKHSNGNRRVIGLAHVEFEFLADFSVC